MTILVGPAAFCTVNLNPNVPVSKRLSPATNIRFVVGESLDDPPPPQPVNMNVDARAIPKSLMACPKDLIFRVVARPILASP